MMYHLEVIVHCNFCNKSSAFDTMVREGVHVCPHCGQEVVYISGCETGAIRSKPNPFMDEVGCLSLDVYEGKEFKRTYHIGVSLSKAKTLVAALMDKCISTQITWDGFISLEPVIEESTEEAQEEAENDE